MTDLTFRQRLRRTIFLTLLVIITFALAFLALVYPAIAPLSGADLQTGQVVQEDIQAPQDFSYQSEVLTEQQREVAARAVPAIYTSPDPSVARQRLERLRSALAFISGVRADNYASAEQKLADLAALEDINLNQESAVRILNLSESRWQTVQQEAIVVLEQVMRSTIREDRLDEVRRGIPTLVSLAVPEDQAALIAEIVSAFIAPNSIYSEDLTNAARDRARNSVAPVTRTFKAGETVVQRGQVLVETDLEALAAMGMVQPQLSWKNLTQGGLVTFLSVAFLFFYLRRKQLLVRDLRGMALITLLFVIFLFVARLIIPGHVLLPYVFPLAAYSLTVAVLFSTEIALLSSLPLAVLVAYELPNALDLTIFYALSSLFGVLAVGRARRLTSFFGAGAAIAGVGAMVAIAYRLTDATLDWMAVLNLSGAALLNGIAAASLAVLLQFFLAQLMGMTTALQLMDISRPDHPLLQLILRTAPGTYQHSLQVANLAEQAAEQIEADTLLTRVGALYHDIGKTFNPIMFIENQMAGSPNPHDELTPIESSAVIIQHVPEGLELARKHRLPRRIQDFISEHHGSMITRYQYVKAVEAAGGDESLVDEDDFRYPGPRPQSRETAILMLADGCEARVRAGRPADADELRQMIKDLIQTRVNCGDRKSVV